MEETATPARGAGSAAPRDESRALIARLDRIDAWSLPYLFIGIIGLGFLFTFYDIFDINVSFIQSCVDLKSGCTPVNALSSLKLPVFLNLTGYVVGTLALSPLADRYGRRNMLLVTMALTGLGSLYNALAPDYTQFILARVITGFGIGADLAIVNTFIGEVAPRRSRARFTSVIFVNSAIGAVLGIWAGLILTTKAAPWPNGLSFAQASPSFDNGWRWMYAIGALLALIAVLLRYELPESPRWLISRGRLEDADEVIGDMERTAERRGRLPEPQSEPDDPESNPDEGSAKHRTVFHELLTEPVYRRRVLLLVVVWFLGYMTLYGFAAGFTSILTSVGYKPPEAGVIVAVGAFGFIACAVFAVIFAERIPRKIWLPIGASATLVGSILIAAAGDTRWIAFAGAVITFFGFNVWVPVTYARSAENFPTRARTTGFALVDGVGHLGGGISVLVIAPAIPHLSTLGALILVSSFLVVAAVIGQWGIDTRGKRFEDLAP
jgi:putative MFS transporter